MPGWLPAHAVGPPARAAWGCVMGVSARGCALEGVWRGGEAGGWRGSHGWTFLSHLSRMNFETAVASISSSLPLGGAVCRQLTAVSTDSPQGLQL